MQGGTATAGRKRAAVELIAREGEALRHTARRYSLCAEDAEDAYQRGLEILLTKAPTDDQRELIRWTTTVVKHEALAVRRNRERLLGKGGRTEDAEDPIARIAADASGPGERVEERERIARSREALRSLKPAELRSLTLLAAGYSYAEIGEITGFSKTKVNRCLAEGRERFRDQFSRGEDGSRCAELAQLLSAYCDGEASAEDAATVREHLRACAACRVTMRAYRATPAAVAALAPVLPVSRSLLERGQDALAGLHARLPGVATGAGDSGVAQVATAGGTRGAGLAALAKVLTICAGTVGGAAACVATGVAPAPIAIDPDRAGTRIERVSGHAIEEATASSVAYEPAPEATEPEAKPEPPHPEPTPEPEPAAVESETAEAGAVEYVPPPPSETPAAAPQQAASSGSAAGEFGP